MWHSGNNPNSIHEDEIDPWPAISYGVGYRHGLDPQLLWLSCRPAAAALIRSLAWELPYATGVDLKSKKKKKKKNSVYAYESFRKQFEGAFSKKWWKSLISSFCFQMFCKF